MSDLIDWFGQPIEVKQKPANPNPCITAFGEGPPGQTCKGCVHLRYPLGFATRHWKCDRRTLTHGKATDHKVSYPACAKYEKREGEYHGG